MNGNRLPGNAPMLLLLGGLGYLRPVIEEARRLGFRVATLDYLPGNKAHRHSDLYFNASVTDKEGVLEIARANRVAGVMAFAVDPAVETAAYVCEKLGLPSAGSYESVKILQRKPLFRKFLEEHGFNVPLWIAFTDEECGCVDIGGIEDSMSRRGMGYPVMVKPADGAGSKGVTLARSGQELAGSVVKARGKSRGGGIIIEEYIEAEGAPSGSEAFSVDGEVAFFSVSSQQFLSRSGSPYVPCGNYWPSDIPEERIAEARREFQRLLTLLGMRTSLYNVELRYSRGGKLYLMEVSPRGGGNGLAPAVGEAYGVPLVENAVRGAVGLPLKEFGQEEAKGIFSRCMVLPGRSGVYKGLYISPEIKDSIREVEMWVKPGDMVERFSGANGAIGMLLLEFDSKCNLMEFWNVYKCENGGGKDAARSKRHFIKPIIEDE